ncbi:MULTISPECIES: tRNA-dihydrouridine synthase family protein [unclassified Treponema]|uniref:tRNA-dihydrouridine synthase family protein n=1 Tax=unclassified Treponema TaxID=2638727 RepID=UPI0020A370D5|nr:MULTISPECIES: tRNA-dihydrouridine synthase family protein [unclassified Treponema]UTC66895.1 tRNA-dihydrouridine synthase family protein [Treponema sp. OMZ 789]UTC69624.1 tRNA-dihydrouridine synthase family protein [Treponema sp. OMZ 790]UTC72338.1 tRNA-dihydrouridine synthase family protein [Treponema sp. OMZ 791]
MNLISAPMAAITHSAFRRLIACFKEPGEYFSEMIHAPSAISGGGFEKWYFRTNPSPEKLVWQITSPDAEAAADCIPLLLQYGGFGIDLNMGCCAPQIVNTGAGFAWMKKPILETASLVNKVKKAVLLYDEQNSGPQTKPVRLSVKLRLGEKEDYDKLLSFCKMLISEGADLITLHPRTQKQKYSRPCKHEYTARLASDLSIPVYGNGDINSLETLEKNASKYPCSGWMIGRAAVQKPWIFYELSKPNKKREIDLLKTAELFLTFLQEEQPKEFHLTRAQRFFAFFCDNFSFAHHIKSKVLNCKNLDDMLFNLRVYFEEVPEDRLIMV